MGSGISRISTDNIAVGRFDKDNFEERDITPYSTDQDYLDGNYNFDLSEGYTVSEAEAVLRQYGVSLDNYSELYRAKEDNYINPRLALEVQDSPDGWSEPNRELPHYSRIAVDTVAHLMSKFENTTAVRNKEIGMQLERLVFKDERKEDSSLAHYSGGIKSKLNITTGERTRVDDFAFGGFKGHIAFDIMYLNSETDYKAHRSSLSGFSIRTDGIVSTAIHEFGHAVQYSLIRNKNKELNSYLREQFDSRDPVVSKYASKNGTENFAENFALYARGVKASDVGRGRKSYERYIKFMKEVNLSELYGSIKVTDIYNNAHK